MVVVVVDAAALLGSERGIYTGSSKDEFVFSIRLTVDIDSNSNEDRVHIKG